MHFKTSVVTIPLLLCLFANTIFAQSNASSLQKYSVYNDGIRFDTILSWKEVQAKARTENKMIFMDCYASWCGPCKYMDRMIFPQKMVGDYFNSNFISVRVQMDETSKDSPYIQRWYADAAAIGGKYGITSYPTYLFFTPDGEVIHRASGSTTDGKAFIAKGKEARDPSQQYYTQVKKLEEDMGDSAALVINFRRALDLRDNEHAILIGEAYLNSIRNPFTRDNIPLFASVIQLNQDPAQSEFMLFVGNANLINGIMEDSNYAEKSVGRIIYDKKVMPLFAKNVTPLVWKDIVSDIHKDYPNLGRGVIDIIQDQFDRSIVFEIKLAMENESGSINDWNKISLALETRFTGYEVNRILLEQEVEYFAGKKFWKDCTSNSFILFQKYGNKLSCSEINEIAWYYVFQHSNNRKELSMTLKLVKLSNIKDTSNKDYTNYLDTYANLLYKNGKRKKAIVCETKALKMVTKKGSMADIKAYTKNLNKMLKRQPTWNGNSTAS